MPVVRLLKTGTFGLISPDEVDELMDAARDDDKLRRRMRLSVLADSVASKQRDRGRETRRFSWSMRRMWER